MRAYLAKWFTMGAYFLTPEDSSVTVYRVPFSREVQHMPHYMGHLKAMFWILIAFLVAMCIAQLR
jgi:hypothetical protein